MIFGQVLENLRKSSERGRKSSENRQKRRHQYVYIIKWTLHVGRRWEFHALVARTISHLFAALTREILFLPLEHKIHIFSPTCNILCIFLLVCILIRLTGSSKYGTTRKNIQRYYTPKRLMRYISVRFSKIMPADLNPSIPLACDFFFLRGEG